MGNQTSHRPSAMSSPYHLSRLEQDLVGAAIVVEDLKRPVLLHVLDGNLFDFSMMTMLDLFDVEDSRNDMSPQMV